MTTTDRYLENNARYADQFGDAELEAPPARKIVIVACMDARFDPSAALGIENGDAHVLRNADGVVTDDVIRSLAISQRLLGHARSCSSTTPPAG